MTNGAQRAGVKIDFGVEHRIRIGPQGPPVRHRGIPVRALRRVRTPLEVSESGLVRGDHAGLGPPLDAHVADGHPALHGERFDGRAAVLHDVALAAAGADLGDQRQHDVLGGHPGGQLAVDVDRHRLRPALGQGLGGQHVLDLRGADAERDRPEGAVGGGVRVAADHGQAGLGQPELGADDVHDSLIKIAEAVDPDAELRRVPAQRVDLGPRHRVGDRAIDVQGGGVVVLGGQGQVRPADRTARLAEAVERLRTRHLVDEVEVDEEQIRLALRRADDVVVPYLFAECPAHDLKSSRRRSLVGSTDPAASSAAYRR